MNMLEQHWYGPRRWLWMLWPLQCLFRFLAAIRRWCYRIGVFSTHECSVPLIVVGNIAVGGTGKTPVVIALVQYFQRKGLNVGVVSRGYGGKAPQYPFTVENDSLASQCGDEPLLIAQRTGAVVVVDPVRVRAVKQLQASVDVVISDDGMQHYAMHRCIEIAVVDAVRQFGNRWLLPTGPLREPVSRLRHTDMVLVNGARIPSVSRHWFELQPGELKPLNAHSGGKPEKGAFVHAVAGIGHPERFFALLEKAGFVVERNAFPDHHPYRINDFTSMKSAIVMTEKDAVKCRALAISNAWYVPVDACIDREFWDQLENAWKSCTTENRNG